MRSKVSVKATLFLLIDHDNPQSDYEIKTQALDELENLNLIDVDLLDDPTINASLLLNLGIEVDNPEEQITIIRANVLEG